MIDKYKILNAVSEGIKSGFKFSSNNIKDDSSSINFSDSKINNIESFNIGKLENDFVDLGLSVKWAKYNIGATCQNTPESWYGNYYAWGEIEPKQIYNENSYSQTLYEKYSEKHFHILQPEDDVVTQTYYGIDKFRMPTKEEFEELLDKSKIENKWKIDYQGIEGLNGREFTSKINGNSIFIPAASHYYDSRIIPTSKKCHIWTKNLSFGEAIWTAWNFYYESYSIEVGWSGVYYGYSVRGVCS